jgi:hypothetical protein
MQLTSSFVVEHKSNGANQAMAMQFDQDYMAVPGGSCCCSFGSCCSCSCGAPSTLN